MEKKDGPVAPNVPPVKYKLIFGSHTWCPVFFFSFALICGLLYSIYGIFGPVVLRGIYNVVFGYFILLSIHCAHYWWNPNPHPDPRGFYALFSCIASAILIYTIHDRIFSTFLAGGVAGVTYGHLCFIIFGFHIAGYDDTVWDGKLSAWLPTKPLRSVFWYLVTWVVWVLLYGLYCQSVFSGLDLVRVNGVLACVQWVVMQQFTYGVGKFNEAMNASKWPLFTRQPLKGLFLTFFHTFCGVAINFIIYGLEEAAWGDTVSPDDKFHHSLLIATYPLIPSCFGGLLTNYFAAEKVWYKRLGKRVLHIYFFIAIDYWWYHLIFAPWGFLGSKEFTWWHHDDLLWNFAIAIVPLTHHWFCARWGWVRREKPPVEAFPPLPSDDGLAIPPSPSLPNAHEEDRAILPKAGAVHFAPASPAASPVPV